MESKLKKIELKLVQQYAKLEGIKESQMVQKLENIDWTNEFKLLNKNLKVCKILIATFSCLSILLVIMALLNEKDVHSILLLICSLPFFVMGFQDYLSKINSKLRVLGLLFEIYK